MCAASSFRKTFNAAETGSDRPRIAYLTTYFPGLTETAVIKEMYEVDRSGLAVEVVALRGEYDGVFDEKALRFKDVTQHFDRRALLRGWLEHSRLLARADRRYLAILRQVATESGSAILAAKNFAAVLFGLAFMRGFEKRGLRYLHANFGTYQATSAWAIHRLTGIPYGFTVHAHEIFVSPSLMRAKLADAALPVTISDYNIHYMRERLGLSTERVERIRCGVDLSQIPFSARPKRDIPLILGVARLDLMKGFEFLIDAAGILKTRGIQTEIEIIGRDDGGRMAALQARAEKAGVAEVLTLPGVVSQDELWAAYRRASIFALPCITAPDGAQDGVPATLMEAMAAGVPTVSARTSGIPELVVHGETGLLADPEDAAGLADQLQRLIREPALAARLAEAGREKVAREYDSAANARQLAARIRAVIEQNH